MKKIMLVSAALIVLSSVFAMAVPVAGPTMVNSASHQVNVQVLEMHNIAIAGGNVSLVIENATAGQDPIPVSDSHTSLAYTINSNAAKKITAQLDQAFPAGVTLQVAVTDPNATGIQTLGTTAVPVVTGLSKIANPSAALTYTASATAGAGELNETHTVTYTIVAAE